MPPRRGRGRGRGAANSPQKAETPAAEVKVEVKEEAAVDAPADATANAENAEPKVEVNGKNGEAAVVKTDPEDVGEHIYQIKVSNMPDVYTNEDFQKYIDATFKVKVPKVISPQVNSPWVMLCFSDKIQQEDLAAVMHNHVWRKKSLRAVPWLPVPETRKRKLEDTSGDSAAKKSKEDIKLTLEEEVLSESLPFFNISYENQNRLSRQDAELMAHRLHGLLCDRNAELAGWAEKSCEDNDGNLFKLEPLKVCSPVQGYRNKCKLRVGKNAEGELAVGFSLSDNSESKILAVEPGDKFVHLPESMKHAAKAFQQFARSSGKPHFVKKAKTGFWDSLLIRAAPDGALMLVVIVSPKGCTDDELAKVKEDLKTFFTEGEGKDCNVFSLYLQLLHDVHPIHPLEKLELLHGRCDYEENICGLKFYVSPFSILNINPSCSENIYNSVIELAEPTPDSVVIDVCAGSCGIAFTFASKVEKAYAIEPQEENVRDALKTKALNNITNVEIIKGKCEDHLEKLFEKVKDKKLIVVLDPPRHGVASKIIAQIRAQPNVEKVIYVCSTTKTGVKNFLDFCSKEGKDTVSNQTMSGLPFLPIRAIPIDVAPFTVNNTVPVLFKRVDPSTFPAAKNPPPKPIRREQPKKKQVRRPRQPANQQKGGRGGPQRAVQRGGGRGGPGGRGPGGPQRGPPPRGPRGYPAPPFMRPLMGGNRGMPFRNGPPPPGPSYQQSLINKYERQIADLEQQNRAFKAGLSMGLQAAHRSDGSGGGGGNTGGVGGYRGGYSGESSFQPNVFGDHATDNFSGDNFYDFSRGGPANTGGYGSHASYGGGAGGGPQRNRPLMASRFVGVGRNNSQQSGGAGGPRRGGRGGGGGGRGGPRGRGRN